MMKHENFRLKRPEKPSLFKADFNPFASNLDEENVWKNLGGKTLVEAYELFLTNPLHFQEDYMWMGARAFDYYFPVLDEYLRAASAEDECDDHEVNILGSCIVLQFETNGESPSFGTQREIADLAVFVLANLGRFTPDVKAQRSIERSWRAVQAKLEEREDSGRDGYAG
jgi:hypothetical protein